MYLTPDILNKADDCNSMHLWWDKLAQVEGAHPQFVPVRQAFDDFFRNPEQSISRPLVTLCRYAAAHKGRVWMIMDEVGKFVKHKDTPQVLKDNFPEEQRKNIFNWLATGSVGMGMWIRDQHLNLRRNCLYNLPLFSDNEMRVLVEELSSVVNLEDMARAIGSVTREGVHDWLKGKFAGCPGLVVEFYETVQECLNTRTLDQPQEPTEEQTKEQTQEQQLQHGDPVERFACTLKRRVEGLLGNICDNDFILRKLGYQLSQSPPNLTLLQNAGLCGGVPPSGWVMVYILEWLGAMKGLKHDDDAMLDLISSFLAECTDATLRGCLIEMRTIAELSRGFSLSVQMYKKCAPDAVNYEALGDRCLLPNTKRLCVWEYLTLNSELEGSVTADADWYLMKVSRGFDVVDVVLLDHTDKDGDVVAYGIQVTVSEDPFNKHQTFDTCSPASKAKLEALWTAIAAKFGAATSIHTCYVMYAPGAAKVIVPKENASAVYFSNQVSLVATPDVQNKKH